MYGNVRVYLQNCGNKQIKKHHTRLILFIDHCSNDDNIKHLNPENYYSNLNPDDNIHVTTL